MGQNSAGMPLSKRLNALRRAPSLRDPGTTSSLQFSPSVARSSWESPGGRSNSSKEEEEEHEAECKNLRIEEPVKFLRPNGVEKATLPTEDSGKLSCDFKNLKHALEHEVGMEDPGISSHDNIRISGFKKRDEGERIVLLNWRNRSFDEGGDLGRNERDCLPRRSVDESRTNILRREAMVRNAENQGEITRMASKQRRREKPFKRTGTKKDSVTRSASPSLFEDEVHISEEAFSLFSLNQDDHVNAGLSWRDSSIDCGSRLESPLLKRGELKKSKSNIKTCSNISRYNGKHEDDSNTPTPLHSLNKDGKRSIRGSCDGTAFSGDDEMDSLDLPRNGCGLPCYWSRTLRVRSKNFPESRRRNLGGGGLANSVWRKGPSRPSQSKIAVHKDSRLSAYETKTSGELNLDMEALPLLTDVGGSSESSGDDGNHGSSDEESGGTFMEEGGLNRKRARHKRREKLELALTSESREVTVYTGMHRNLSQKYRPRSFDELVGQNMVVQSLVSTVLKGKVAPVYLFQGPRGTGKTSTARIFASALNCFSLEELRPCGLCRECIAFASGRSVDVREVDATNSNGLEKVKSLLKNVASPPSMSRFKIFIIDECHMLVSETWAALLKCFEEPPAHAVFILVTTDPDKLPHTAVSRCQKYLFPKIKESEIASRLQKLAIEENLDVDTDALDFIAIKADGSLRDGETMLDQLSLLGQRITLPMVHDLVGFVSDEKLLDLLDLALSADAASTVRKARDLISSGIEPMALMSQLANLIMDILAGSCKIGDNKHKGIFFHRNALTEDDLEKLRRALRILSEAEKQLRASNDRTTWLTAALLQFAPSRSLLFSNSTGTSVIQSPITLRSMNERGVLYFDSPTRRKWDKEKNSDTHLEQLDLITTTQPKMSMINGNMKTLSFINCHDDKKGKITSDMHVTHQTSDHKPASSSFAGGFVVCERIGSSPLNMDCMHESGQSEWQQFDQADRCIDTNKLDDIWRRTIEECHSSTLKQLLQTEGKLVSVSTTNGLAIAQLEFQHPDHKSRAERSWKNIANSLQHVLGCNVEVRFVLVSLTAETDNKMCRNVVTEPPNSVAGMQRQNASTMHEECTHHSQSVAINSDRMAHGEALRKSNYSRNLSQLFTEPLQTIHNKSPLRVQHFQEGILSTANTVERKNQNTSCGKQEAPRTSKDAISDEQRLERAWSREEEKSTPVQLGFQNPEKLQLHPQCATDFQNGMASSGAPVMIPFRVALQKTGGMLNRKANSMQLNALNNAENKQSAKVDDLNELHMSSQNPFVASFADADLTSGPGSEPGRILCWKAFKSNHEKAVEQRKWPPRKSALLTWVVPCAKR